MGWAPDGYSFLQWAHECPQERNQSTSGYWTAAPLQFVRITIVGITTPGRELNGPKAMHKERKS